MTYLEALTFRLAAAIAELPPEVRGRHARFLLSRQQSDGGFCGREGGSDLYYTGFALRGLALCGELDGEPARGAADFLRGRLLGRETIIDFLSLLYGAVLLRNAAGVNPLDAAPDDWSHRAAAAMELLRRDDGGYSMSHEGFSSSTYYTFLVLLCQQILEVPPVQPERLVEFVLSRRREDGGFVELGPMKRSGTNPTAAAVGTLQILDALAPEVREGVIDYLCDRQDDEGGLAANTRIPFADVLSTFTGCWTLSQLGALHELDRPAALQFVRSTEDEAGGFRAGLLDPTADVEYTFYGLGALALLIPEPSTAAGEAADPGREQP